MSLNRTAMVKYIFDIDNYEKKDYMPFVDVVEQTRAKFVFLHIERTQSKKDMRSELIQARKDLEYELLRRMPYLNVVLND